MPTLYHFITIDYSHINILAFNIIYTPPHFRFNFFQLMFKDALEDHSGSCPKSGACDICRLDPSLADSWSERHRYLHEFPVSLFPVSNPPYSPLFPHTPSPPFYILFRYGRLDRIYEGKTLRAILSELGWRHNEFPGTQQGQESTDGPTDHRTDRLTSGRTDTPSYRSTRPRVGKQSD